MRFKISSMLMVVLIFALSLGWLIDRSKFDRQLGSSLETQELIFTIESLVSQKNAANSQDTAAFTKGIDRTLITALVDVYENSNQIDELMLNRNRNGKAVFIANDLLQELECSTADEYLSRLSERWGNKGRFAKYNDPNTTSHSQLRSFVQAALDSPMPMDLIFDDMNNLIQQADTQKDGG